MKPIKEKNTFATEETLLKLCNNESLCYCPSVGFCETINYNFSLNSLVQMKTNIGDHNRQYFFTIKATNNANLTSVEHLDILVDDSPPETGMVFEGPIDGPDIDYTDQNFTIVHWHGFIDHESGINSFIIGVSNHCLSMDEMTNNGSSNDGLFVKSKDTATTVPLRRIGKHIVSVIAFNNAMEPSKVACSDGISRDLSNPVIANVSLQNARIADSIGCSDGKAWFIHNAVTKVRLIQTAVCKSRCSKSILSPMIEAMSEILAHNKPNPDQSISEFLCSRMIDFNESIIYLPTDTIHLKWDIMDESQIDEVQVGFGSSPFSADIISYTISKHNTFYKERHLGLESGSIIYCFLKVVNKASLEAVLPYGPILIDETPPNCPLSLPVLVQGDVIVLAWDNGTFFDFEQREQIGSIMFQIGNEHRILTPFYEWNIHESTHCTGVSGGCIKYPIKKLQQHNTEDGLSFFFRIHAFNYAGHFCSVDSNKFPIPSMFPPGNGYIKDPSTDKSTNDIDISFLPYFYCATWDGFWHHLGMEFSIGVGLNPGTDDIIKFKPVNNTSIHCEHDTSLTSGRKYFITVVARCSGGTANATSDGFFIFDKQNISNAVQVYDGIGCNGDVFVDKISTFINISKHGFSFHSDENLHIGKHYTLIIPNDWNGRLRIT
ncbi:hypothetical protein KUTeg_018828 [Tegillarca granosa]|uniref:Uncharacterized protein n=1 Tax=Tegillarca granosa TaxID=220873 RepID=A0ABQ9EEV3_TEGGR|nr:hypothetical protein KUTeg_018828 [Tegillarca granosa]